MNENDQTSKMLWWVANVLLSFLAIAIAFYDGLFLAVAAWIIGVFLLMVFRPDD